MKNIAIQNYSLLEFSIVGLENGGKFPIEYTGRGKDISPEIIIHNLSPKAKTIAIYYYNSIEFSSNKNRSTPIYRIPFSSCQGIMLSRTTTIFLNESPIRENTLVS